jgi:hypothetical protein
MGMFNHTVQTDGPQGSSLLGPYLVNVRLYLLAIDLSFGHALLIDTHSREVIVNLGITLLAPIRYDANNYLLPGSITPRPRVVSGAEMTNVLHNPMHRLGE